MLELHQVAKRFGTVEALQPCDLTIEAGKVTVLIGPSGCGKSTLLRLMIGLLEPDAGTVCFAGEQLAPATIRQLRQRMGYVIQDGGLFPHLTARENAVLMTRVLKWDAARTQQRLDELLELTHFPRSGLKRYPVGLSGGQRQRVSLMRALMLDPDVLLLDEPLGALDPMIRSRLQGELRAIFRRLGKTVVLVTHDLAEAAYFADMIVLLRQGRIVQQGSFAELVEHPSDPFVSRFVQAQRGLHGGIAGGTT